jgi:hypothetical protein
MNDFREKYYRIKFLLVELISKIDKLNDENDFFERLESIKENLSEVQQLKSELIKNSNIADFEKISPELNHFAKLIKEKFDNIIEEKKRELIEVSVNIKNLQNSRKLINYNR